jgi:hypothetical protein
MKGARPKVWLAVFGVTVVLLSGKGWSQHSGTSEHQLPADAIPPGPSNIKIEFENESVPVLRIRMSPHEKIPMHDLSARLVVWLTQVHLRDAFPDGRSQDMERAVGAIDWVPAQRHAGENLRATCRWSFWPSCQRSVRWRIQNESVAVTVELATWPA